MHAYARVCVWRGCAHVWGEGLFVPANHDVECVVLRIGNKNGFPFVEVTCFLVEVTRFFLKSDLQNDSSLAETCGALRVTFLFEKWRMEPFMGRY